MISYAFYSLLLINLIAVAINFILEKADKIKLSAAIFPVFAFIDIILSFLVFANYKQELPSILHKLSFTKDLYLTYGFLIDKTSTAYLLILSVSCFCAFLFCYAFSIIGINKNIIFSILSVKIFFLKLAILAAGFFQFIIGIETAFLLSGVLIFNGRNPFENNNKFLSFFIFEIFGGVFIFIVSALWLSLLKNDSFLFNAEFIKSNSQLLKLISLFLWIFIWTKGAFIFGNLSFIKNSIAHFPSFIIISTLTFPLCFLIILTRLSEVLLLNNDITEVFTILGIITAISSAFFALFEKDIAAISAFLISSQIGLAITLFIINNTESFLYFSSFQIMANLLFLLACGSLIEAFSNEYLIEKMGGAIKLIPITVFMLLISSIFIIISYTNFNFTDNKAINISLLIACFIFSTALFKLVFCTCFGKTRAEDVITARIQEKSFFIILSMSISAVFITTIFYYNYVYNFSYLRILSVLIGLLSAFYLFYKYNLNQKINFSFADIADNIFFKYITLPVFKGEFLLKNSINNKILNITAEKFITKILYLLSRIHNLYQKETFVINFIFFIAVFLLTLTFFILLHK